jgi:CAAX protease family protein
VSGVRSLAAFFALTFAASWSLFFAAGALWARGAAGAPGAAGAGTAAYLLGVFAPALVALALSALAGGRDGIARITDQLGRWPPTAGWYAFAIGFIVAVKLAAAAIHRVMAGGWPAFGIESIPVMLLATLVSTPVQAGEEIGWRGYALPRMSALMGLGPASILLGAIWAAWHLPFFFIASDKTGQSFIVYALAVIAISVALAWLYWRTGASLVMTMLMHAAVNNLKDIVPSAGARGATPFTFYAPLMAWLTTAVLWVCAGYCLMQMRGAALPHADEPAAPIAAP